MNSFLGFLSLHMNTVINILGALLCVFLIINLIKLYNHKDRIKGALERKNVRTSIDKKTLEITDEDISEAVTPDTMRGYETDFNKSVSVYDSLTQLIPVFPLFGILGTVAGLMLALSQTEGDLSLVANDLDFALRSTFWGLIWTIGLKILVALTSARMIEDTEILLDDYNKKFDNSVKLGNITD